MQKTHLGQLKGYWLMVDGPEARGQESGEYAKIGKLETESSNRQIRMNRAVIGALFM
jgi:hypothetical protein